MDEFDQKVLLKISQSLLQYLARRNERKLERVYLAVRDSREHLNLNVRVDRDATDEGVAQLRRAIRRRIRDIGDAPANALESRLCALGRLLGLTRGEMRLFGILYRYSRFEAFSEIIDAAGQQDFSLQDSHIRSILLGRRRTLSNLRFDFAARLFEFGLVQGNRRSIEVSDHIAQALDRDWSDSERLAPLLLGPELGCDLEWSDFDHIAAERDRIAALIESAFKRREKAIHILLYGESGTGKSELARALAARLGAQLHAVGECDRDGSEPNRGERLGSYRVAQKLASKRDRRLLVVEEADDILGGTPWSMIDRDVRTTGSKAHLHRFLETTETPTIWTTNSVHWIDKAILRRMTFAMAVKAPSPAILTRLWQREGKKRDIELNAAQSRLLAEAYEVPPGLVTGAIRFASLTGGGIEDLQAGVSGIATAMRGGRAIPPPTSLPAPFVPVLCTADTDLVAMTESIVRTKRLDVSFCLHGAPGTGKTSFARHLAEAMGLRLVQKRASDLISKWVGDTEKLIAEAFAEARERKTLLMFDEADSLLRDRAGAYRGWEVSQVNEMLTWMESHPLPFVCATNLMEGLDTAAHRRFVFKIRFDWLDRERQVHAFRHFFGLPAPARLDELERLSPGDFAAVARKAAILGKGDDPAALVAMLADEVMLKPGARNPIGFKAGL